MIFAALPVLLFLSLLPVCAASSPTSPFPSIPFRIFSSFVEQTLSPNIPLATVLLILLSLVENTDLLNLHHRQKHPLYSGEYQSTAPTAWMKAFARALSRRCPLDSVLAPLADSSARSEDQNIAEMAEQLDGLSRVLSLTPYSADDSSPSWLKPVSRKAIEPVRLICPATPICLTGNCLPRYLKLETSSTTMSPVALVLPSGAFSAYVLGGRCNKCQTHYFADHESFVDGESSSQTRAQFYINGARYLKIGQSVWADRKFTSSVMQATYTFHGSANTYMQYWNRSFSNTGHIKKLLSRRHIWEALTQESIRMISASLKSDFTIPSAMGNRAVLEQVCFSCIHGPDILLNLPRLGPNLAEMELSRLHIIAMNVNTSIFRHLDNPQVPKTGLSMP